MSEQKTPPTTDPDSGPRNGEESASAGEPAEQHAGKTAGKTPRPPIEFDFRSVTEPLEQARELIHSWTQNFVGTIDKLVADLKVDAGNVRRDSSGFGRAMATWMAPFLTAARATPRAGRLAREVAAVFGAYRWHEMRTRTLTPEAVQAERDALDRRCAQRITDTLLEMRGAAIKIGQFASTRRDLLPPAWIEALSRLQDQVRPVDLQAVRNRIEQELGAPLAERFALFDPAPLAAASLAQVHGAVLEGGTRVAVKVQVPGVEEQVEGDLALLKVLGGFLSDLTPTLDLAPVVAELTRSVREELDYRLEAARAQRMAADLADFPEVHVPRVFDQLSTDRVLTLERIDGERLSDFLARAKAEGEAGAAARDRVLTSLVRTYAVQILALGRFQADPHPGNFLVEPSGRLALLDFGALETLRDEERRGYAALVAAVIARDRQRAAELCAALGFRVQESGDPDALVEMAELILDAFRPDPDRPLGELDPRAAFDRALSLARDSAITVPHHFVQLGRVLAALAGLLLAEKPDLDLFGLIAPYLTGATGPATGS